MKTNPIISLFGNAIFACIFASCASSSYRVIETSFLESETPVFQDIDISYDLWANGGKLELTLHNTADKPMFIDWLQSTVSFNGRAFALYQPTTSTSTTAMANAGPTDALGNRKSRSFSKSLTIENNRIEIIPPGMQVTRVFFENAFTEKIVSCELELDNSGYDRELYDQFATPFDFDVSLAYCSSINCDTAKFATSHFYVSAVALYSDKRFKGALKKSTDCDGRTKTSYEYPAANKNNYYFKESATTGGGGVVLGVVLVAGILFAIAVSGGL